VDILQPSAVCYSLWDTTSLHSDWLQHLCYLQLSTAVYHCPLLSTAVHCYLLLFTAIYCSLLLSTAFYYLLLPSARLKHALLLSTYCHMSFLYLSAHSVLICLEHQHAVYGLDEHLKRHHGLVAARRKELLATYAGLTIYAPKQVPLPAPNRPPIAELGQAKDAFLCCQEEAGVVAREGEELDVGATEATIIVQQQHTCGYISTNRQEMRKHTNQQHCIKLTRWSSSAAAYPRALNQVL
jgi:hypothetical protein